MLRSNTIKFDVPKEKYTPSGVYYTCRYIEVRDGVRVEFVKFKNKELYSVKDLEGKVSWSAIR